MSTDQQSPAPRQDPSDRATAPDQVIAPEDELGPERPGPQEHGGQGGMATREQELAPPMIPPEPGS
ncbi:hypothetical protein [Nakamurella leprariae]|uniref:Uncharacterized protein n=1 Tax=Nakamurella leprariae TaxID=2803911 RepID=A0A938YBM8_9ACTN|nr:hypothetical protein [Nakamurella leprariae]MBM9469546.1 hypothetical protein [Nakamurella leprariae]